MIVKKKTRILFYLQFIKKKVFLKLNYMYLHIFLKM